MIHHTIPKLESHIDRGVEQPVSHMRGEAQTKLAKFLERNF